jgi:ParB family transcriptional regulator, chromosome partitioning protein
MARKPIGSTLSAAMAGSVEEEEARIAAAQANTAQTAPHMSNPAVDRAKEAVKSEDRHATRLIPTNQVRMSLISDRMDPGEDLDELIESIRLEGQQVPILVRRLPDGELEIVYGRRRLLACRALKIDVRATVKDMTDEEALIAQGVENNRRKDSSFIEKALFVARILDAGYKAVVVQRAIGINDSMISKMKGILKDIPDELIRRIGPAHGAGRRQWELLRALCQEQGEKRAAKLAAEIPTDLPSVDRLNFALVALKPSPAPKPETESGGSRVRIEIKGETLTVKADKASHARLLPFLKAELSKLVETWESQNKD